MAKVTERDAKIRLYDGTGTPFYLELDFDAGFSGPMGAPQTEELLILNRGKADSLMHYIEGDEMPLMAPIEVGFTVLMRSDAQTVNILDWISAMNDALATLVNSNTLVSTESDTQRDGANNNPAFAGTNKGTCNIEYLIEMGGTDRGFQYNEVYLPISEQSFTESPDGIELTVKGMCYGTIARITAFTAGTDVEV